MDIMYMATLIDLLMQPVVILVIMDIMYMPLAHHFNSLIVVILVIMDIMYMDTSERSDVLSVVILVIMDIMYMLRLSIKKICLGCNPCYNGYHVHATTYVYQ